MKKLLALLLAGAMCLPLLACNADNKPSGDTEAPTVAVTQPVTDPEETTDTPDESSAPDESVSTPEDTTTSAVTGDDSDEPEDPSDEPEDATKEPEGTTKEPEATTKEPEATTKEPEVTTKEPEVTTKKPEVTTKEPEVTNKEPEVIKPDNIPASGTVNMASLSSNHGYKATWSDAGYSEPVIVLGYNVPISLGHINLANYSKVRIQYGCDGGAGTQAFFNKLNGNAPIGLKSNGSSYGHAGSYVMDGDIAHADMTFSIAGWASGARWVEIDLSGVTYAGDVWVAVHNPEGTEIAISAIVFTPNGQEDTPVETQPSETQPVTPPTEVKDPVYNVPLATLVNNGQASDIFFSQSCAAAWGASNGYVTLTANGPDPYVTAIPLGSSETVTNRLYVLYRTTSAVAPEFFIGSGDGWTGQGDHAGAATYTADGKWHLLSVNLSAASALVNNQATYLRFDFFATDDPTPTNTMKIDVKMLAFFNSDAEAKAYAAAKYGADYSGTYTPPASGPDLDGDITLPGNLALPYVPSQPAQINNWRAVWISQFDLSSLCCKNGTQRSQSEFRALIEQMMNNIVGDGYNTVIVQVRPNADSMYPSEYYPPSKYAVGSYGNNFSYDPFAIVVEIARGKGLDVHAWINPMRGMSDAELQSISNQYPIKQWYNDPTKKGTYLRHETKNGLTLWYLNPAYEEVRALIVNGAVEIVKKYDVQGVHMDDYFYPVTPDYTAFDSAAYSEYCAKNGTVSVADFRRACLNKLVSAMYGYIKQADSTALFGISPAGDYNTVQYYQCADIFTWCSTPGYIDYIMPQIYWGFEHATSPFDQMCNAWQSLVKTNYVKLIIGMTAHKAAAGYDEWGGGTGKYEWRDHKDILARSVNYTTTLDKCVGITVFCYQYLFDPLSGAWNSSTAEEHTNLNNALRNARW